MDVQPVAFVFGLFGLVVLAVNQSQVRMCRSDLIILFVACVFVLYFNPLDERFAFIDLRKVVSLPIGFVIYVAGRNLLRYFTFGILQTAAIIALAFQVFQTLVPSLYALLSSLLLARTSTTVSRGYGGAFPEAAFAGYFGVLYLILYALLRYRGDPIPRWRGWLFICVCVALMVLSLSVTALSIAALMGLIALTMTRRVRLLLPLLVLTVAFALLLVSIVPMLPRDLRVVQVLQSAINRPAMLLSDESVVNRLNSVLLGLMFPLNFPVGSGVLFPDKEFLLTMPGYQELSNALFNPRALAFLFEAYPVSLLMNDFAVLTFRMGWIGAFIGLLFVSFYRGHRFSRLVQAFVVVTTLGSFPLSLPPIYLLLAWMRTDAPKATASVSEGTISPGWSP